VEAVLEVYERRQELCGLAIAEQPRQLRHFTARFVPLPPACAVPP
jgi:tryptophanase